MLHDFWLCPHLTRVDARAGIDSQHATIVAFVLELEDSIWSNLHTCPVISVSGRRLCSERPDRAIFLHSQKLVLDRRVSVVVPEEDLLAWFRHSHWSDQLFFSLSVHLRSRYFRSSTASSHN